jgi:hypothetical protein
VNKIIALEEMIKIDIHNGSGRKLLGVSIQPGCGSKLAKLFTVPGSKNYAATCK